MIRADPKLRVGRQQTMDQILSAFRIRDDVCARSRAPGVSCCAGAGSHGIRLCRIPHLLPDLPADISADPRYRRAPLFAPAWIDWPITAATHRAKARGGLIGRLTRVGLAVRGGGHVHRALSVAGRTKSPTRQRPAGCRSGRPLADVPEHVAAAVVYIIFLWWFSTGADPMARSPAKDHLQVESAGRYRPRGGCNLRPHGQCIRCIAMGGDRVVHVRIGSLGLA